MATNDQAVTVGANAAYPILDEDTLVSDSDRALATQQSVKAYVDTEIATCTTITRADAQTMIASGSVTPAKNAIYLNHISSAVAATIADLKNHVGLLVIKNISASGSAAHTVTVTTGTLDGANKVATLDAGKECLVLWIDPAGNGTIVANVGTVVLS